MVPFLVLEHTHSTSVQTVRCSLSLFPRMRSSDPEFPDMRVRLTHWIMARWCARWP